MGSQNLMDPEQGEPHGLQQEERETNVHASSRSMGDNRCHPGELHDPVKQTTSLQMIEYADRHRMVEVRTPSPTPSEHQELDRGVIDWWILKRKDFWLSTRRIKWYVGMGLAATLVVLLAKYHEQIVKFLTPATQWAHDRPAGWLIPVAILLVVSFPPLFGHEIIGFMCGVAWGIGIGFGILAFGTIIGEAANFFVFKYWCTARGEKYEKRSLRYACLARAVRHGGFKVVLAVRLSLIPPHLITTMFATIGMSFPVFMAAAIVALPRQLLVVYIGVLLKESVDGTSNHNKAISAGVSVGAGIVTSLALVYIVKKMNAIKPQIIYERRKARGEAKTRRIADRGDSLPG